MERLSGENGTGNREIVFTADQWSASEIGCGSNTFQDGGKSDEGGNIGIREVVLACCDWCLPGCLKSGGQGLNMYLLIVGNVFEVVVILTRY